MINTVFRVLMAAVALIVAFPSGYASAEGERPQSISTPGDQARQFLVLGHKVLDMSLDELTRFLKREGFASRFVVPESVDYEGLNYGMKPEKLKPLSKLLGLDPILDTANENLWILIFHDGQDVVDIAVGVFRRSNPTDKRTASSSCSGPCRGCACAGPASVAYGVRCARESLAA